MAISVNTNLFSLNAQRNLGRTQQDLEVSMQRLSSGLRVNTSKDDAGGLAVATRMDAQARGLDVAARNANDAISLLQVADGGLANMTSTLQRMRELAVQASNGSYSDTDRGLLDKEYAELKAELTRLGTDIKFNGLAVIGANAAGTVFQVGADAGQTLTVTTTDRSGLGAALGAIGTAANASAQITAIDTQLNNVNGDRAVVGAGLSRLDAAIGSIKQGAEAQHAARSRIMDADFAMETARMTRAQILQQAGVATLSQANSVPQLALSLLG